MPSGSPSGFDYFSGNLNSPQDAFRSFGTGFVGTLPFLVPGVGPALGGALSGSLFTLTDAALGGNRDNLLERTLLSGVFGAALGPAADGANAVLGRVASRLGNGILSRLGTRGTQRVANRIQRTGKELEIVPEAQIIENRAVGNAARDAIARRFPGSRTEVFFRTPFGRRFIDVLTRGQTAIEPKVGRVKFDPEIQLQVQKDLFLRESRQIDRIQYIFTRSPATGKVGPTPRLERFLRDNGIDIIIE